MREHLQHHQRGQRHLDALRRAGRAAAGAALALAACAEPTAVVESVALRDRSIEVAGTPVHVLEAGDPSAPALVLLHGRAFEARTWADLGTLALAAQRGLHAVAVDLPGFGSSPPSELAPERFLGAFLDAARLERPIVVCPSMSGVYALPFAVESPERLAGLVPVAPAGIDSLRGELGRARVPTLVVWGGEDHVLPVATADELVAALPEAELVVLEGASHACYLDQPERFHELLLAFCGRPR